MHKSFYCPNRPVLLSLCWIFGFGLGIFAACNTVSFESWMRLALSCRVSIVLVFVSAMLPLLIAAYAVMIDNFMILCTVCFLRCMCYSFLMWLCVRSFAGAAWLLQPMLQFTDGWALIFLSLLCFSPGKSVPRDLGIFAFLTVVISAADHYAVSSFLMTLLSF